MKTLLIACEVLRPELEVLASDMRNPPPMNFLEQRLHDYPEKLRSAFQGLVDAFEQENDGPLAVLCGYGLVWARVERRARPAGQRWFSQNCMIVFRCCLGLTRRGPTLLPGRVPHTGSARGG